MVGERLRSMPTVKETYDQDIRPKEQNTAHIMRASILGREAHEQDRQEERDDLEGIEPVSATSANWRDADARRRRTYSRESGLLMIHPMRTRMGMTKSVIWMHEPTETASARSTLLR